MFEAKVPFRSILQDTPSMPHHNAPDGFPQSERFADIDPVRTRLDLETSTEPHDPQFVADACRIVDWVDGQLDASIAKKRKEVAGLFEVAYPTDVVVEQHAKYFAALTDSLSSDVGQDAVVAFPMYGALSFLYHLSGRLPDTILFPIHIHSEKGTEDSVRVEKPLPRAVLDPRRTVIFTDDISASSLSVIRLALLRRNARGGRSNEVEVFDSYDTLLSSIQMLRQRKDSSLVREKLSMAYALTARLCMEEGVVLAPLYNKNQPLTHALTSFANRGRNTRWEHLQQRALEGKVDVHGWVMGGKGDLAYPLVNTNIAGTEILLRMKKEYRRSLQDKGLHRIVFRIGAGIHPLVVLKDGEHDALVEGMANLMTAYMKYREDK